MSQIKGALSGENAIAIVDYSWLLPSLLSWPDLLAGRCAISWLDASLPVPVGAPLAKTGLPDPMVPRGLALAQEVLAALPFDEDRCFGLILGLANLFSETAYIEHVLPNRNHVERMGELAAFSFDSPLSTLAGSLPRCGPRLRLDAACATGNVALIAAHQWLSAGLVDDVLVVAASAMLNPVGLGLFHNLKALNGARDLTASCPFDLRRRGFVMGEGAAAMWLSNHPPCQPKGYLRAYGSSMSAAHFVEPPDDTHSWLCAANSALAGLPEVAYVSAHGTATRAGDVAETRLLHQLFGKRAGLIPISSAKSMLGHCLAAAALIEAIICLETLNAQMAPPTINLDCPDPLCDLDYLANEARAISGNFALSNAFGFGGHNACILLSKDRS